MEGWLFAVIGILLTAVVLLVIKIGVLRMAAREIEEAFADRLATGTNTLIGISSRDRAMCSLADSINRQLRMLRSERHRYLEGDTELKNAVMNISHDLRTPLTAICGYLDLLKRETLSEETARYLEMIRNRVAALKQLTEELFGYSVILANKEPVREPVFLNQVLEESLAAFYAAFTQKGIIPVIRMPDRKVERLLDRDKLSRIFGNLLGNVLKYSDGDFEMELSESGEVVFSNMASQLNEVEVGRLFDRFYTVETGRTSTGLGLSIVRTLTEQMGGRIAARYGEGRLEIRLRF